MRRALAAALVVACSHEPARPAAGELAVDVTTPNAGLSPAEAHGAIALRLSHAISQEPGVGHVTSTTDARGVHVVAWMPGDVDPLDAAHRIEARVAEVRTQLPTGAELPTILTRSRGRIVRVVVKRDRASALELQRWVDDTLLGEHLLRTPGVTVAKTCGGAWPRVDITADVARMAAVGADLDDVAHALGEANLARATDTWDVAALGDVRVETTDGTPVAIREIARIERRGAPDPCVFAAPAGAVVVDARLHRDADADAVRAAIDAARSAAPAGTTIDVSRAPALYDVALAGKRPDDDRAVRALATAWRAQLASAPGVESVEPDAPMATEWTLDRQAVARADLSMDDVRTVVSTLGDGLWVGQVTDGLDRMPVYLRAEPLDAARLMVHGHGSPAPVSSLVTGGPGPRRFELLDNRPAVIVRFTVDDPDDPDGVAAAAIARARAAAAPGDVRVTSWREP